MALTAAQLVALARLGGATVAKRQPDGTATAVHPALEDWYAAAIGDEDSSAWGSLFAEAMAAKTAHYCLMFPWNDDGMARGLVTEEPVNGAMGTRKYLHDYTDAQWWSSTAAGALYRQLRRRLGGSGPLLCI
jgi:hypothetical protein